MFFFQLKNILYLHLSGWTFQTQLVVGHNDKELQEKFCDKKTVYRTER